MTTVDNLGEPTVINMNNVLTEEQLFSLLKVYVELDGMTYTEAICEYCRVNEIDPEDIALIIKGHMKDVLEVEAVDRNIIKNNTGKLIF